MPHIDLIYFNAGGGHRAAAEALREVMNGEGSPWQVRLLNLFELLDPQDRFRRITRMRPECGAWKRWYMFERRRSVT